MKHISCDLETFSSVNLAKSGVYRYVESPDFDILLFSYACDGGKVKTIDLAQGEALPGELIQAIRSDEVVKWAFNAQFERICLSEWLRRKGYSLDSPAPFDSIREERRYLNPGSWRCSMIWSVYLGLPFSLESVGAVLGLERQKLKDGKELIRYFSMPCQSTIANGGRTRNLPEHAPDKWKAYAAYNKHDVEIEMGIQNKVSRFPMPESEWHHYVRDQEINDLGILIDQDLALCAIRMDEKLRKRTVALLKDITDLSNPNSVAQLKDWLSAQGVKTESLDKKSVAALLEDAPDDVIEVLRGRQELSKSSVKKYQAMMDCVCKDGRARGLLQFYGANRTGRFAGRLIQVQNLPRNKMEDLELARSLVKAGDLGTLDLLFASVPQVLSELIRTAFVPSPERVFLVADYSAIEARVLAWLAGESWRMKLFESGGDIYCQSASEMFGVPVEKHGANAHLRQKGKISELACIAEGELVLTDQGLIPIEHVSTSHLLWDGESWVRHEGVIYKGMKEVIEYEGLKATADHLIYAEGKSEPIRFGDAATSGAPLVQTGNDRRAIRLGENHRSEEALLQPWRTADLTPVYDIRNAGQHHRFTVSGKLVHNCGYGGSVGALKAMGALEMGLKEDELPGLVAAWRSSNHNIVRLWYAVDEAAKIAIKERRKTTVKGISFECVSGMLIITLPSKRQLFYVKPRIGENRFGGESITYEGVGTGKRWERLETYGAKLVENIVQAISRDLLCEALQTFRNSDIVMHVHDEIVIEANPQMSLQAVCEQISRTPDWAKGLLLNADGFSCSFYCKD